MDPTGSNHSARIAAAGGVSVIRIYVRLASLPAADVAELLSVDAATGSDLRIGFQASSGRLTIRFGNAAVTTAATAISADTWYRLSLRVAVNADPRTANWQIDGVAQTSRVVGRCRIHGQHSADRVLGECGCLHGVLRRCDDLRIVRRLSDR